MVDFYELIYAAKLAINEKSKMNSIQKECTDLKHKYDACYTSWFTDHFLQGDTKEDTCAPLFSLYQQCLKVCRNLKDEYDACFNYWFAEKFLKGDHNDSMCARLLKTYTECVQRAMKEHNIHLKEIENNNFEVEKNMKTSTNAK